MRLAVSYTPGMAKTSILLAGLLMLVCACGEGDASKDPASQTYKLPPQKPTGPSTPAGEPQYIKVDHILIGVKSERNKQGLRDPVQAKKFAYALLEDLKNGADWDDLKRQNSEDPPPGGPYGMSNTGAPERSGYIPRKRMVAAFGDVGFVLEVGEMKMADWDLQKSYFGYHIIKRVE